MKLTLVRATMLVYENDPRAGVGKVRPTGQIRPAKVFCTVRGKDFQLNQLVFHVQCYFQL